MHLNIVAFKSYALRGNLVPRILPGFQMLHTYKTLKSYEMEPACMGTRVLFASWRSDRLHGLCAAVVRLAVYDAVRHVLIQLIESITSNTNETCVRGMLQLVICTYTLIYQVEGRCHKSILQLVHPHLLVNVINRPCLVVQL